MLRGRALVLGAKRGPRVDLPLRGARSAAPALSPGSGAALVIVTPALTEPETPCACAHARAGGHATG